MTIKIQRETVRLVCPHCRRTYVIKVDLKKIYRTKPRAVCSRCGGRFEVIQRMYELEESLASTNEQETRSLEKKRQRKKRALKKAHEQVVINVDRVKELAHRDAAPREESAPTVRQPTPPAAGSMPESPAFPPSAEAFSPPFQRQDRSAPPWPTSTVPPAPSPYPIWSALSPLPEPPSIRAPSPEDLEQPMPWLARSTVSLEAMEIPLPKSIEILEWLLTDQPERPQGASPPPVPPTARDAAPSSPAPEDSTVS
jgi:hypothetical protein